MPQQRKGLSRRLVLGGAVSAVACASALPAWALGTPPQTSGPFYPVSLPLDHDNDLVKVDGAGRPAAGHVTHLLGRVLDEEGRPQPGVQVEIWQCDANGYYHHPRDRGGQADPAFQGYGQTVADGEGAYRFRTIKPVSYPGRTPHIHVSVAGPGFERLVTQLYVEGEPQNARDFIYRGIGDPAAQALVTVPFEPADDIEAGALAARWDIVLDRRLFQSG